jgi:hypothetical protein
MAILASLADAAAAFLSALLILAAAHKLLDPERARRAASDLLRAPAMLARGATGAAVALELAAGFALILPATRMAGALMAAGLWLAYTLAIQLAIGAGRRDLDCGCSFAAVHAPLGGFELTRNLTLAALAVGVAAMTRAGAPGPIPPMDAFSALVLVTLYVSVDQTRAIRRGNA